MGFSRAIREQALVFAARRCCVCRRFKGVGVEVHQSHIWHMVVRTPWTTPLFFALTATAPPDITIKITPGVRSTAPVNCANIAMTGTSE